MLTISRKIHAVRWRQFFVTFLATLSVFTAGTNYVWTSPSLPILYAPDSPIPTTVEMGSWIASAALIADIFGAPLGAFSAEYLGRRVALFLTGIPYVISWFIIAFATQSWHFVVARFLAGISDGSTFTILPIYTSEISDSDLRGQLGNAITAMLDAGTLFMYCIGPFFSIQKTAFIMVSIPIIQFLLFHFIPETPFYYMHKDKEDKARKSLEVLRGTVEVDEELISIKQSIEEERKHPAGWLDLYRVKHNLRATWLACALKMIQQLTGIGAYMAYTQIIFHQAGSSIAPKYSAIIFGLVQFLTSLTSSCLVDHLGRRPLLIFSLFGCFVSLFLQSIYFMLQHFDWYEVSRISYLPLIAMGLYIIMYSIGIGPLALLIPGELFATNVKSKGMCIADLVLAFFMCIVMKFYQSVSMEWGTYAPFFFFSAMCLVGLAFAIWILPETKGHTLAEIQEILQKT